MYSRWLKEILDINGVDGVVVVAKSGEIIENIGTELEHIQQQKIAIHVLRLIAVYDLDQKSVKEIELIWYDYRILVMSASQFIIIIFCGSNKALSLVRITVNVVIAHLLEDRKLMKKIRKILSNGSGVLVPEEMSQMEIKLISKLQ